MMVTPTEARGRRGHSRGGAGTDGLLGGDGDQAAKAIDATPVAATGSLEQLASRAGCKPVMQIDADKLREARSARPPPTASSFS